MSKNSECVLILIDLICILEFATLPLFSLNFIAIIVFAFEKEPRKTKQKKNLKNRNIYSAKGMCRHEDIASIVQCSMFVLY